MDSKKLIMLLLLSAVLLAGCLGSMNPPAANPYEIFSNIPTDNAKAVAYFKFNENGTEELQSLFGTMLTKNLKDTNETEAAIVIYNDSLGLVAYSKTDLTVNDEIDSFNSQMGQRNGNMRVENKSIGGKEVTIIYMNITGTDVPVCMWKEGDIIKTVMMIGFPQETAYSPSAGFETSAQSPMLGYALQVMASPQGNFGNTCDVVITQKYDTSKVNKMFNETDYIKSTIPISGTLFGEIKLNAVNNSIVNGSIYGVMFGNDDGDNLVLVERMNMNGLLTQYMPNQHYCFSSGASGVTSTIVTSDNKQACMQEGGGTTGVINARYVALERDVGNYKVYDYAYIKGRKDAATENAKNIIFSTNLPGTDATWSDSASVEVRVYSGSYYASNPLSGARVDLYQGDYYTYEYGSGYETSASAPPELMQTLYTDNSGVATFQNIRVNGSLFVVASKEGYANQTEPVYSYTSPTDVYITKSAVPVYTESNYTESSATTNVTIDEASLSDMAIISSDGTPQVEIVVGEKGSGRDVKAAGNIAAMIGNRAYKKVGITAMLSDPHCTPAQCICVPSMQTADVPVKLDTSEDKLVILDSNATGVNINNNLISVGHPSVNTITADVMKNTNSLALTYPGDYITQAVGTNRIIIAGYDNKDTAIAANLFMQDLITAGAGGGLTFSNTPIISAGGIPLVRIVVGEQSTTGESVEAANIAAMIGNVAYRHQPVTAYYSGTACIPSLNYSSQMVALNPATNPLVMLDTEANPSAGIITIGSPDVNTVTKQVFTVGGLRVEKGKAIVQAVGNNRIVIAGGTEMDTERAADRFIEWFATKYN